METFRMIPKFFYKFNPSLSRAGHNKNFGRKKIFGDTLVCFDGLFYNYYRGQV